MSLDILLWLLPIAAVLAGASFLSLRSYNRFTARARGAVTTALPRDAGPSPLDALFDPLEAAHPGQQGLFNLPDGRDAFAVRALAARQAGRSIDIITYIWSTDMTGWLMIAELIAAADRGVRVRLLLDDVNVQGLDPVFLGLNQHPNVHVRLFNPIRSRGNRIRRAVEFILGLSRFNRRIHSKVWITDGRLAVLGGRNVGDVYFGAVQDGRHAAKDADVALVGSMVAEIETVFDTWWNLGLSLPIVTLWPKFRISMRAYRRRIIRRSASPAAEAYLGDVLGTDDLHRLVASRLRWTDRVEVISDPPEKAYGKRATPWLSNRIGDLLREAKAEVRLATPYFVPGWPGLNLLADLRKRGVAVTLLTNSLATTDHSPVHGAYTFYRRPLLDMGVRLYELAPPPGSHPHRNFLHSKVFLFDDRLALIGSANFDLRSANINIELGLVFEEPGLMAELLERFRQETAPDAAYEVIETAGRLNWRQGHDGTAVVLATEPGASLRRQLIAGLMRRLPHAFL